MANNFASFYQMFNALSTVGKSRFVEWFDGNDLSAIWTITDTGASSGAMSDVIDAGYKITTGTASSDRREISFNQKRNFSNTSSTFIVEMLLGQTTLCVMYGGFMDNTQVAFANQAVWAYDSSISANYTLTTFNVSQTDVNSNFVADTNWHVFSAVLGASSVTGKIVGANITTNSSTLPTAKLQPHFQVRTRTTVAKTGNIRYLEAYNT